MDGKVRETSVMEETTPEFDQIANTYALVQDFYGRQMRAIDSRDITSFVRTLTPDARMKHPNGSEDTGRDSIAARLHANASQFEGLTICHWFDKLTIDQLTDETVKTSYYAMVSRTTPDGATTFQPPFVVHDVLVRNQADGFQTSVREITVHGPGKLS